jgi:hypothetical protein
LFVSRSKGERTREKRARSEAAGWERGKTTSPLFSVTADDDDTSKRKAARDLFVSAAQRVA